MKQKSNIEVRIIFRLKRRGFYYLCGTNYAYAGLFLSLYNKLSIKKGVINWQPGRFNCKMFLRVAKDFVKQTNSMPSDVLREIQDNDKNR